MLRIDEFWRGVGLDEEMQQELEWHEEVGE